MCEGIAELRSVKTDLKPPLQLNCRFHCDPRMVADFALTAQSQIVIVGAIPKEGFAVLMPAKPSLDMTAT